MRAGAWNFGDSLWTGPSVGIGGCSTAAHDQASVNDALTHWLHVSEDVEQHRQQQRMSGAENIDK